MKIVISLIISLLSCLCLSAQSATEYFNVGNPINYCNTEYYLSWSAHPQENYYIQEYLPKGESLEHYNQMFTVSVIFLNIMPLEAVQAKIAELEQRKQTDPITHYKVAQKNGEYILEFIVGDSTNGLMNSVEVNVHHYKQITIKDKKAIVLSFYSGRAYEDDILSYIQSIPDKRNEWYMGMSNLKINPKFQKK